MTMPKASMNEYGKTVPGEDEIRLAGQIRAMQPVPESGRVDRAPHK